MLTRFKVKNFKNFHRELVFDLAKVKNYEFNSEGIKNSVVNKAIVYGPNASGKSNLGFAIFDIVSTLTDKEKNPSFYKNYLYANDQTLVAEFEYTFQFDGSEIRYEYGKKSQDDIVFEHLFIDGQRVIEFDRRKGSKAQISLDGTESLKDDLGHTKISIVKFVFSNSILEDNKENRAFKKFQQFAENMLYFRSVNENSYLGYETGSASILADIIEKDNVKDFEEFLNSVGIKCKLEIADFFDRKVLMNCYDKGQIPFWETISTGTRSLALFYFWLQRLRKDTSVSFLFIDEFDAFYHHNLSKRIVEEVKQISPQSILTTHNTGLMSNDILRPDCYYILEDNEIYQLYEPTSKELRKAHNIEKMYRAGAFANG